MTYLLHHYYEKSHGPFKNLSGLSMEEAARVTAEIKRDGTTFAARRSDDYLLIRRELERKARDIFISKGGKPANDYPHYMTLGPCEWIQTWYKEGQAITFCLDDFKEHSISFTYGDLFPTMRCKDGKPYREQVYTKSEIMQVIRQYGLPQEWNEDGSKGPERYIEVQIWNDEVIGKLRS
jgi:hypothetical protein